MKVRACILTRCHFEKVDMDFRLRRPASSMNVRVNTRSGCAGSGYQKSVKSRKEPPWELARF